MGVMHEPDNAYSIRSTWSCYWLDQFLTLALNILILLIFYISMDLSINYFAHFSGCRASFVCSCHSILECCVTVSGVKLSIRLFVLSMTMTSVCQKLICIDQEIKGLCLQLKRSGTKYEAQKITFSTSVVANGRPLPL